MMNPAMATPCPVSTEARVERLVMWVWQLTNTAQASEQKTDALRLKGGHLIDPLAQGTIVNLRCEVVFMSLFLVLFSFSLFCLSLR